MMRTDVRCKTGVCGPHSMRPHNCGAKVKVERDGVWYCNRHDPVSVIAKRAIRDAEFDKQYKERQKTYALNRAAPDMKDALLEARGCIVAFCAESCSETIAKIDAALAKAP